MTHLRLPFGGRSVNYQHLLLLELPTVARGFVQTERVALSEVWAPREYLHTLLDAEFTTRVERAVERCLRAARLPTPKTLPQFDRRYAHGVERPRIEGPVRCE